MVESKIVSFEEMIKSEKQYRREGKKIVLCHGLFQSLHIGHMRYLKQSRNYGDIVFAAIVSDKHADNYAKVDFNERLRAEAVASLDWIDEVVVNPYKDILELIKQLKPDVFVKGFESGDITREQSCDEARLLENMGVKLVVTKENDVFSSSQINRYLAGMPEEIHKYLNIFKQRHTLDEVQGILDAMQHLNVLIIGDTILDEYQYCQAIGKSSKDPTLALKYKSSDIFAGGVLSVANHVAEFSRRVDLVTILGENNSYEDFIRSKLKGNINPKFLVKPNSPTLIKRRFIDGYAMNKLLEIYIMNDSALDMNLEQEFYNFVQSNLSNYDLVITSDFGHGTVSSRLKKLLAQQAHFLAVNAQSNAGNRGFNSITKYPRADYITMAEHEIRLEMRDLTGRLLPMMSQIARGVQCEKIVVTRGRKGCTVFDKGGSFTQVPSFAQNVVDRIGAGDAFFALTSLAAVQRVSEEIIGFIGNVAGSLAVEIMGNEKSIKKQRVGDFIKNLL